MVNYFKFKESVFVLLLRDFGFLFCYSVIEAVKSVNKIAIIWSEQIKQSP